MSHLKPSITSHFLNLTAKVLYIKQSSSTVVLLPGKIKYCVPRSVTSSNLACFCKFCKFCTVLPLIDARLVSKPALNTDILDFLAILLLQQIIRVHDKRLSSTAWVRSVCLTKRIGAHCTPQIQLCSYKWLNTIDPPGLCYSQMFLSHCFSPFVSIPLAVFLSPYLCSLSRCPCLPCLHVLASFSIRTVEQQSPGVWDSSCMNLVDCLYLFLGLQGHAVLVKGTF